MSLAEGGSGPAATGPVRLRNHPTRAVEWLSSRAARIMGQAADCVSTICIVVASMPGAPLDLRHWNGSVMA